MNAWEHLAEECDKLAEPCAWCGKAGHEMADCASWRDWYKRRQTLPLNEPEVQWYDFAAAIAVCAVIVGLMLAARHWGW